MHAESVWEDMVQRYTVILSDGTNGTVAFDKKNGTDEKAQATDALGGNARYIRVSLEKDTVTHGFCTVHGYAIST